MMASSLASTLGVTSVSSKLNSHGVPQFTVQKPAPNPLTAYLETLKIYQKLTSKEKLIYPPLLPRPANNPYATTTVIMSARDMFFAIHKTSGTTLSLAAGTATPNAGSDFRHGSTKDLVWWENYWGSKQTIVARVNINGGFGNTMAQNCNSIATFLGEADGTVGNNRGAYGVDVKQVLTSSDVYGMTNWFVDPLATAFYFYGHGTASGNAIGTQTAVIGAKTVGILLGNYINPPVNGKPTLVTHKPFNFVFLDGCNTGLGDFPEAFGIPKHIAGAALNEAGLHKRAFMGWTGEVTFQFDSSHLDWTLQFWTDWMDGGLGDRTVAHAINAAYQHDPSVFNNVPIKMYGNGSLQYSD
jgi:hypothetical protein